MTGIKMKAENAYHFSQISSIQNNQIDILVAIISAPVKLKNDDWASDFYTATFWFPVELFKIGITKTYNKYQDTLKLLNL